MDFKTLNVARPELFGFTIQVSNFPKRLSISCPLGSSDHALRLS